MEVSRPSWPLRPMLKFVRRVHFQSMPRRPCQSQPRNSYGCLQTGGRCGRCPVPACCFRRKHGKMISIEAHEAVKRSQPEITVAGLNDGNDGTLRQALLVVPGIHNERRAGRHRPRHHWLGWLKQKRTAKAMRRGASVGSSAYLIVQTVPAKCKDVWKKAKP